MSRSPPASRRTCVHGFGLLAVVSGTAIVQPACKFGKKFDACTVGARLSHIVASNHLETNRASFASVRRHSRPPPAATATISCRSIRLKSYRMMVSSKHTKVNNTFLFRRMWKSAPHKMFKSQILATIRC